MAGIPPRPKKTTEEIIQARMAWDTSPITSKEPYYAVKAGHWPNGTSIDALKPFWVENTAKTYATLDEAVDDMGGQMPSYASFGVVKFDS